MKPKLPRALLWKDKQSMDEILGEYPGEQLYRIYHRVSRGTATPNGGVTPLKLLNEVFYQCTRVVYEKDRCVGLASYLKEIKADMGQMLATKTVLMLMLYLLKMQSDKSKEIGNMIDQLQDYFRKPDQYYLDFDAEDCLLETINEESELHEFFLRPHPCPADELLGVAVDWSALTHGFSRTLIKETCRMWDNERDRIKVMMMIEKAFIEHPRDMFEEEPCDVVDMEFFKEQRGKSNKYFFDSVEQKDKLTYEEQKCIIMLLEKKINALESELEQMKSELNSRMPESQQERSFTLSLIVDYCKNKCEWSEVRGIVAMLYKLTRRGSDEEEKLVDSIEEEFNNRSRGNTYNAPVGQVLEHVDKVENKSE